MNTIFAVIAVFAAVAAPNQNRVKNGGPVRIEGEGKFAVVNTCAANKAPLEAATKTIGKILAISTEVADGKWTLAGADEARKASGANVAVFVTKDAALPISLIAMESRWGVVNANGMDDSKIEKEVIRVATVLLGAAQSRYEASAMRPVATLADLDKAGNIITIDGLMAISSHLKDLGITTYHTMSYRDACYEGLAPAPRNDLEKQIAKEVADELAAEEKAKKENAKAK